MRLRAAGLSWSPEPGQYVFDINGMVRAGSPFQAGIFLINRANTFEARAGGQEELFENFAWLPTWEDCRRWLRERGTTDESVLEAWKTGTSKGLTDRETMYDLMLKILEGSGAGA